MNTIPKFKTGLRAAAAWGLIIGCLALPGTVLGQDKKEPSPLVAAVPLKLTGFSQFPYTAWDKGVDSFSARRVRFSLSGELFKNVNYKIQVDAVKSPLILDALVEFKLSSEVGLRDRHQRQQQPEGRRRPRRRPSRRVSGLGSRLL